MSDCNQLKSSNSRKGFSTPSKKIALSVIRKIEDFHSCQKMEVTSPIKNNTVLNIKEDEDDYLYQFDFEAEDNCVPSWNSFKQSSNIHSNKSLKKSSSVESLCYSCDEMDKYAIAPTYYDLHRSLTLYYHKKVMSTSTAVLKFPNSALLKRRISSYSKTIVNLKHCRDGHNECYDGYDACDEMEELENAVSKKREIVEPKIDNGKRAKRNLIDMMEETTINSKETVRKTLKPKKSSKNVYYKKM